MARAPTRGSSTWAIIASVTWKVIGFGMLLFVAAIQAIPREINEAADGRRRELLAAGPARDAAADRAGRSCWSR